MRKSLILLATLVLFLSIFMGACGQNDANDDVDTEEDNQASSLQYDMDRVVSDIRIQTMQTVNYMYEQGTITKEQNREGVKQVFDTTEEVKEDIQKDPRYEDIADKLDKEQLDEVELNSFLAPYLQRIQEPGQVQ